MNDSDRDMKAWERWQESSEKLDYFILGVVSALTAYLGDKVQVGSPGLNPATAELAALVCFGSSVLLGIERLRGLVAHLAAQTGHLEAYSKAGQIRAQLLKDPTGDLVDTVSGRPIPNLEARAALAREESRVKHFDELSNKWIRRGETSYSWRDRAFMLGIALYVGAKVWAAVLL